jgi:glycerophosphoryl diester phosphodiesterase
MLIIGHRGARGLEPENTLRAVVRGMGCADYIEVDVRTSRDGVPVIIHDAALDRTTNGHGPVADFTLAELKEFDAGQGERIPTLEEVLALVRGRTGLIVEMKEDKGIDGICALIQKSDVRNLVLVSFLAGPLSRAKSLLPGIRTGLIYSQEMNDPVNRAREIGAEILLPRHDRLHHALVEEAHRQSIRVIAWTLNAEQDIRKAARFGIDGFATDDPCTARTLLEGPGEKRRYCGHISDG